MIDELATRIRQFIDDEMRSCSMDIGGITPLYIYRMWGGSVAIEDIADAMEDIFLSHTESSEITEIETSASFAAG